VDAYIAKQPVEVQAVLQRVRRIIRRALPEADETISYQIPTYKVGGQYVVYFAGWKAHWSIYPVTEPVRAKLRSALAAYELSKGTVRFPLTDPVPAKLVERIVRELARAAERTRAKSSRSKQAGRGGIMKQIFFATSEDFRAWLERHHDTAKELLVGFAKKASGQPSISWQEAVDQGLCFGWIDGIRHRLDDKRYTIRFTPRKAGSRWSAVNIDRAVTLKAKGLMKPAGIAALEARSEAKSRTYSYEQVKAPELDAALAKTLKANRTALAFMKAQAPSYQRKVIHWISTAKSAEVRRARLQRVMDAFEDGRKL